MTEPEDPAYAAQLPVPEPGPYDYDAFLSYSRADTPVAEGIQKGLHSIGRKLGRLHALRVFRDKTDLAASPSLWAKLTEALDKSRYLVVVLSPNSAGSEWVNKEIDYWLTHRGRTNLILVMADGTLLWDDSHGRFDPDNSTASPPALAVPDALGTEPVYIDVSQDNPWDIQNPVFRDKLTDIAAPIHGKPKYELASDDLREQQRFRRFRRLAIAGLAILTILSVVTAGIAFTQRREAIRQRNDAVALRLATDADAIFKRVRGGPDDRALQELTIAARLAPEAARGGMLTGLQATAPLQKIIRTPQEPKGVRVTPDGQRIITGSMDEPVIRVWDITTGQQVSELTGQAAGIVSGLSADGKRLLSFTLNPSDMNSSKIGLWDLDTGTMIRQFEGRWADLSADGTRIAAIRWNEQAGRPPIYRVEVWNADTGKTINTFPEQTSIVLSLALSPDGHRVVITDGDDTSRIWEVDSGKQIGETITIPDPRSSDPARKLSVLGAEFSPDGSRFATSDSQAIRQWDAFTGAPIGPPTTSDTHQVLGHAAYSPDGKRIAASIGNDVHVWDAETGSLVGTPMKGQAQGHLTFTPNGSQIVSVGSDGTIRIWRADADDHLGGPLTAPADRPKYTTGLAPGGQRDHLGTSAVWNLESDQVTKLDQAISLAMTPDGRRAAAIAYAGKSRYRAQVWDLQTGRLVSSTDEMDGRKIAISSDGTRFATDVYALGAKTDAERFITVYDADTGKRIDVKFDGVEKFDALEKDVAAFRFSPDGRQLVAANVHNMQAWDVVTGKRIGDPWGGGNITALTFSPNGRLLASGGMDQTISIWDAQTHQMVGEPLTGLNGTIRTLVFSSDGQLLVSGSDPPSAKFTEARIWDVASGQSLGEALKIPDGYYNFAVAISGDGTKIFASQEKWVWQWPGPPRWRDLLCDKLSSNMSRAQWKRWVSPDIEYVVGCPDLPIPES
ncbi:TIR domain-containing protein [Mycobacteroides chelonae]|nr:TIR domain-containing protein [Mycobacteroides chelonae]OHU09350.1 hypothetical protein BKG75_24735 [Mycobacteroides chelonae]